MKSENRRGRSFLLHFRSAIRPDARRFTRSVFAARTISQQSVLFRSDVDSRERISRFRRLNERLVRYETICLRCWYETHPLRFADDSFAQLVYSPLCSLFLFLFLLFRSFSLATFVDVSMHRGVIFRLNEVSWRLRVRSFDRELLDKIAWQW